MYQKTLTWIAPEAGPTLLARTEHSTASSISSMAYSKQMEIQNDDLN